MSAPEARAGATPLVALLTAAGRTIAVAESLTGGKVIDALVAVPGASACVRGGVVAYATDVKAGLLSVPVSLLERRGPVDPDVARAMAHGVATLLGADYGVATTGVAGPDAQGDVRPGTFHVAVAGAVHDDVVSVAGAGEGRERVRREASDAALDLALRFIRVDVAGTREGGEAL